MTLLKTNIEKAIFFAILSFAVFSVSDVLRKIVSQEHDILDILFWQAVCGIVVLLLVTPFMGGMKSLIGTHNMREHLARGTLIALNTTFSLQAISRIPITDAYTIFFLTPFVISILGAIFFKEAIGKYRWISIILGFSGAFIAFRPGFTEINPAYLFALATVFTFSVASILGRYIGHANGLLPFAFWPFLCILVGILAYKRGQIPPIHETEFFIYMVFMGTAYGFSLITITFSFNIAPMAVVAPYQYIQIIFALGFDYFLWASVPDGPKMIGAGIIVGAGIFLFSRERRRRERFLLVD